MKVLIRHIKRDMYVRIGEGGEWNLEIGPQYATRFDSNSNEDKITLIRALTDPDYEFYNIYDSMHYE